MSARLPGWTVQLRRSTPIQAPTSVAARSEGSSAKAPSVVVYASVPYTAKVSGRSPRLVTPTWSVTLSPGARSYVK